MLSHFSLVQLFVTLWTLATRFLWPWDFPGKKTGMGCHALLQGNLNPKTGLIDYEDKLTNTTLCKIPQ